MCIIFNDIIWIFMHILGAYSAEGFTGNLFRKISVQEFRNQWVNGRTELKTSCIVSIFKFCVKLLNSVQEECGIACTGEAYCPSFKYDVGKTI